MTDLTPITALGGTIARSETHGLLTLTERPDIALASLARRRNGEVPEPFGLTLPEAGKRIESGPIGIFWSARDQWMVEAEGRAEEDFAATLKVEVPGASVTEQTDGWAALDLGSADGAAPVHALLERLMNVDLSAFGPGSATRTGLEHMGVFVLRITEDRLRIWGMRSSYATLWHAVGQAARRLETR
ncbi:sarcosine oxidase subunit gamma [Celeribacter indicus]|uniref:Sarcosine oxidase, gamma subunit family protein n=1 Tax=Celeribacter indicus TaxID=1208324 RepID=A0A0B5DMH2_9RHOB|nr:sarcosine oxidase subunit gamma [Celeribacter indicus]AJE44843.1 sarcosine oxidase, gamma subunit family protein [Celeribacter indicus]SDX23731.1 sarcosine oxidase subunit gamma [Celeribacter indicus]